MGSPSGLGLSSGTRMPVIWTAGSGQKTDLWGSASQRNVEAEGCGGGREAQNPHNSYTELGLTVNALALLGATGCVS